MAAGFAGKSGSGDFIRIVDLLGIGHLLDRNPSALSGGERQRVAIGRALLAAPRLLLMDEPLAALDEARKAEILPYLERLRDDAGIPIVYVSHSIPEVARLATTVVVMSDGRVAAVVSDSGFVPSGTGVVVQEVAGNRVVVRRAQPREDAHA